MIWAALLAALAFLVSAAGVLYLRAWWLMRDAVRHRDEVLAQYRKVSDALIREAMLREAYDRGFHDRDAEMNWYARTVDGYMEREQELIRELDATKAHKPSAPAENGGYKIRKGNL